MIRMDLRHFYVTLRDQRVNFRSAKPDSLHGHEVGLVVDVEVDVDCDDVVVAVVGGSGGVATTTGKPAPRFWPDASCHSARTSQVSLPSCDTAQSEPAH